MRVGYYPETPELFWINHDKVQWRPLQDIIDDILQFLSLSDDPLIINFNQTSVGFDENQETLNTFATFIYSQLGKFALPSDLSFKISLDYIWKDGRKLLISFGESDFDFRIYHPWLWPPFDISWVKAHSSKQLIANLEREMYTNKYLDWTDEQPFRVAMGNMLPTSWDILSGKRKGLRGMADKTGRSITRALKKDWSNFANVITSDFFHSNDIIDASIRLVRIIKLF